mgnify:CR=1 FL=1
MFNNIGKKIKTLATVITILGISVSVIFGVAVIAGYMSYFRGFSTGVASGLIVMVVGSLASWISSFLLYGFGELIEKTSEIASMMKAEKKGANIQYNAAQPFDGQSQQGIHE